MAEQQFTQEDLLSNQQNQMQDQFPIEPPVAEPVIPMAEFGKEPTESEKIFKQLTEAPSERTERLNDKLGLIDPILVRMKDNDFDASYLEYDNAMTQKNDELRLQLDQKKITEEEYSNQYNQFNDQMLGYLETKKEQTEQYYDNLQQNQPELQTRVNRLITNVENNASNNEAAKLINKVQALDGIMAQAVTGQKLELPQDGGVVSEAVQYRQPKEFSGTNIGIEPVPDTSAPKMQVNGKTVTENEYDKRAKATRDAGIFTVQAFRKAVEDGTLPPEAILETGIYYPNKITNTLDNGKIVTSYKDGYLGEGGKPVYVMMDFDPIAKVYKQRFVEKQEAGMERGGEPKKLAEIVIDPFIEQLKKKEPKALEKVRTAASTIIESPEYSDNVKMMVLASTYPNPDEFREAAQRFGVIKEGAERPFQDVSLGRGLTKATDMINFLQRRLTGREEADLTPGRLALDILKDRGIAIEVDNLLKNTENQRLMQSPRGMSELIAMAKTNKNNKENLDYIYRYTPFLADATNAINESLAYLNDAIKATDSESLMKSAELAEIINKSGYDSQNKKAEDLLFKIEFNADENYRNAFKALKIDKKIKDNTPISIEETEFMNRVGNNILKNRQDLQDVVITDYNNYVFEKNAAVRMFPAQQIEDWKGKNIPDLMQKADQLSSFQKQILGSEVFTNYAQLVGRLDQAVNNLDATSYENITGYFPYLSQDPQEQAYGASAIPGVTPAVALLSGVKSILGGAAKTLNYLEGRAGYEETINNLETSLRDNKQALETQRVKTGNFFSDVAYQTFEMLPMLASFSTMANAGVSRPFLYAITAGDNIKKASEAGLNRTAEKIIYATLLSEAELFAERLVPESVYARRGAKPSLTADLFKKILAPATRKQGIKEYAKAALKAAGMQGMIGIGEYAEEVLMDKITFTIDKLSNDFLNASFSPTEWTGKENLEMAVSMLASTAIMGGKRKVMEMAAPMKVDGVNIGKTAKSLRSVNLVDESGKEVRLDKNQSLLLASICTPTGLYEMTKFVNDVESGKISKYDLDLQMYKMLKEKLIPAAMNTSIFKDKSLTIEQRAAYIAAHGRRIDIEKAINTGEITGGTAKLQIEQIEEDKQRILKDVNFAKQQFNLTGEDVKNLLYDYFEVSDEVIKTREARKTAEPSAAKPAATSEGEPIVTPFRPTVETPTTELFSQMTADEKASFTDDVVNAVAGFRAVTPGNEQGMRVIEAIQQAVSQNPAAELDKAIAGAEEDLNKAKASDTGGPISGAAVDAAQNKLDNLNQIKQKYATKISEGPQQEVGQPSNLVQREGTQEGQPQVGQAEGAVGETTQPAADTRNRNLGSQAQQIEETTKALDERFVKGIESTIPTDIAVSMAEMQIPDMDSEEFRLLREDIAKNGIKKPIKITFYRGDNKYAVTDGNHRLIIAKELGIKNIPFEINESSAESKSAFPYAEYPEIYPSAKNPSKSLEEISSEYAKAKADGSNPELVKAVEDLMGQPAAPVTEAPMQVDELLDLDLKQPGNLEKAFNWLDNADKSLGKQIGSGRFYDIAGAAATGGLITARAIVKALRAAVGGAITLRDAIAKVAKDFNITDKDVTDAINKVAEVENAERLYSKPEIRGVITIANEQASNLKTTEKSSLVAYQKVFSTVQKAIQKIYDSGLIPEGASPQVMIEVTKGIARDAVNAAYPKREVTPKVTMSVRTYIADLLRQQSIAGKKISESSKEVRKVVSNIFKSMNKRFGTTIKYTDSDFRKIMKEIEDAIFRKPITKENTDELIDNVNSIVEQAYIRGFEKDVRPKIAELVDRLMASEMKRFGNIDEAAYSAFGKAVEYINNNQKEFKIKDIQPDDVLAQEIDKKLNKLKKKEKVAQADAQVMSMFATPQVRSLVDAAQKTADDIVKANKGKKIGKTSPTQAYKNILSDLIKKINAMYARGNYPAGIPSVTLVKAASGIAQDAVNAAFPRAEKLSIQEAEMANMSMRDYIKGVAVSQMNAIRGVKNRAKAILGAVNNVMENLKENFGVDFKFTSTGIKRLNKNIANIVFSKMDDTTAIEQIIADVTPIVEYEVKRNLLDKTKKLLDRFTKLNDKARYTGQAGVLAETLVKLNANSLLNSNATLEDIAMLNQYLKEVTAKNINTTNLKNAVDIANKFAPSTKQKAVAGKNAVVDKMQRMIDKIGEGSFDFTDYADLVTAEKAINDFEEQIGDLSDLTDEEFKDVNAKFEELKKALPKPIEQLMEDAKNQIDAELTNQINRLKQAIETSQEFRDSIPNPFFYDELLFLKDALSKELTRLRDNNEGFIASLTPKERMLLSSAIDESFRGNVNSTAYQFSTMVRAFIVFEGAYKFGATMAEKRGLINADGITNFAKSRIDNFRRIFVDIDYNPSSAKLIASGMSVFKIHMLDVSMNTGVDEFGVGTLEKTIYGPIVNANDKAFNMFSDGLTKLEESKKFLNSKGNQAVIKRGIRRLDQTLGTGLFGNATVFKYIKNRLGWDNTLYFDISNRMVSIVKSQIDYISNLKEGQPIIDRTLTRNILKIKPEEFATRKIKNLQELYKGKPMAITEMTDSREMFDILAYGILTDGGTKTLENLSIEELTNLLSQDQQKAMMKWTEHVEDTRNLSEAAMVRRGRKPAFLNNYMPIQVVSDKEGVKDIDDYMKSAGNNVGVDSGQLKARSSETGRMNLDGLSVLYNNLKDLYLVHEVKAPLDALKGIDRAIAQLNGEGNLFAATYAQAVQIDTGNRVKEALDANEKIVNDSLKTAYKVVGAVSSFSARQILIANYRQFIKDYPSNVIKLAATLFFANKRFKNQVSQLANPFSKIRYKTPKGEYVWEDYVEIAKITGSPSYRTVTMRGDNFLYEFSKSKEQLQREQRLTSWQDMRPRKLAWMSKFEEAFFRLTGEYLDHKAFADPRGAYRAIYNTAVQRASDAADALLDREQGLPSIIRQPLKMQMVPILGRFMRNASGGKWTGLIRKNSIGGLVFSFMAGFPSIINQLFFRHIRTTLSIDKSITLKERAKNAVEALVKVVLPQITYNYMGAIQGILQATIDSAVNAIGGSPEEKKEQYAKFNKLKGWELQVAKMKAVYNEAEEKAINAVINSLFASSVDVGAMNVFRPFAGFIAFKAWQQGAVEALAQKGLTKQQVEERKQSIREIENLLFEGFNIKLIHAFPTEEYRKAILSKYGNKEVDALKDIIKVTGAFGVVLGEADKLFDLTKLMTSTDEYEGLSDREIYVAATLKAYSLFFSNIILGGKYGWVFSSFAGDARNIANMLIADEITRLRSEKREAQKGGAAGMPASGRTRAIMPGVGRGGSRFP